MSSSDPPMAQPQSAATATPTASTKAGFLGFAQMASKLGEYQEKLTAVSKSDKQKIQEETITHEQELERMLKEAEDLHAGQTEKYQKAIDGFQKEYDEFQQLTATSQIQLDEIDKQAQEHQEELDKKGAENAKIVESELKEMVRVEIKAAETKALEDYKSKLQIEEDAQIEEINLAEDQYKEDLLKCNEVILAELKEKEKELEERDKIALDKEMERMKEDNNKRMQGLEEIMNQRIEEEIQKLLDRIEEGKNQLALAASWKLEDTPEFIQANKTLAQQVTESSEGLENNVSSDTKQVQDEVKPQQDAQETKQRIAA